MRRINLDRLVLVALLAVAFVGIASATPNPNSAVFHLRVFNDCSTSLLTTGSTYPAMVFIDDAALSCTSGWANLHTWRLSEDGATTAAFNNGDAFRFGADLIISGATNGESGLQISPWWSQDVDGRFNVRVPDGEIACFGGRLPFYSFTSSYGLHYVKGDVLHQEMTYWPNGLTWLYPATIEYKVIYNSLTYSSGPRPFDKGNPVEGKGTWGMLDDARVGAHLQALVVAGNPDAEVRSTWSNVDFQAYPPQLLACCDPATAACTLVPMSACLAPMIWVGAPSCDPSPCTPGACCDLVTFACTLVPQIQCEPPLVWHSEWTSCSPNPCAPVGACCHQDGSCAETIQDECLAPSVWHGEWATCAAASCPLPPLGACCNPATGACALTQQSQCVAPLVWNGATTCTSTTCGTPVPVENKTWGQVKHSYR